MDVSKNNIAGFSFIIFSPYSTVCWMYKQSIRASEIKKMCSQSHLWADFRFQLGNCSYLFLTEVYLIVENSRKKILWKTITITKMAKLSNLCILEAAIDVSTFLPQFRNLCMTWCFVKKWWISEVNNQIWISDRYLFFSSSFFTKYIARILVNLISQWKLFYMW